MPKGHTGKVMVVCALSSARGKGNLFQAFALLLSVLCVTMSAPCPEGVITLSVSSTADVLELSEALLCSGEGEYEVEWSGEVLVTSTISVSNSTSLKITGSVSSTLPQAVVDGGDEVQLFVVDAGSSLELSGLSIQRGVTSDGRAAVEVMGSSLLTAIDCSFSYNSGGERGNQCSCF